MHWRSVASRRNSRKWPIDARAALCVEGDRGKGGEETPHSEVYIDITLIPNYALKSMKCENTDQSTVQQKGCLLPLFFPRTLSIR